MKSFCFAPPLANARGLSGRLALLLWLGLATPALAGQVPNPVNAPASVASGDLLGAAGTNPQQAADTGVSATAAGQNKVAAGPSSGGAGALTLRLLTAADIPNLATVYDANGAAAAAQTAAEAYASNASNLTSGTVASARLPSSGAGSGSVTSVGFTVPSILTVSGSPITGAGSIALGVAAESANLVLAGPASGSAATAAFRSLAPADIPSLLASYDAAGAAVTAQANAEAYAANATHLTSGSVAPVLVYPAGAMILAPAAPSSKWIPADGSIYSQSTYPALYAALGAQPDFGTIQTVVVGSSGLMTGVMTDGAGNWVASGTNGLYHAASPTGTWTLEQSAPITASTGAWDGSQFLITDNSGNFWTSPTGVTWTNRGAPTGYPGGTYAAFIQYLNGVYFAGIPGTGLYASTTSGALSGWALAQSGTLPVSVAYGGGRYVAALGTTIYTSTNGTSWSAATVADSYGFAKYATVYDGSDFITLAATGRAYTSSDGLNFAEVRPYGFTTSMPNFAAWDGTDLLYPSTAFTAWTTTRNRFATPPRLINAGRSVYNQTLTVNNTSQFLVSGGNIYLGTNGTAIAIVSKYSYNTSTQFVVPNAVPLAVAGALNMNWYIYTGT